MDPRVCESRAHQADQVDGKINPADLLTKPKSAGEAARLSSELGYDLIIRKEAKKDMNFAQLIASMMKGSKEDAASKAETHIWCYEELKEKWWEQAMAGQENEQKKQ